MRIIRAEHLGWCFGVRDAVTLVHRLADHGPVTVLGELVHNETVNAGLRQRGVLLQDTREPVTTNVAVITAHGTSAAALERVRATVPVVVEATCPLVQLAHNTIRELVAEGFHPVIVGQRNHIEVRGLTGDLREYDIVLTEADVAGMSARGRFGIVAQTTQPIERVKTLAAVVRERFPAAEVRLVDTVCQPTKQRQWAAAALAKQSDIVVVIGGRYSNNTRELAETCAQFCGRVERVETAADLQWSWFHRDDTVGITAGTSTPDEVIAAVERWLAQLSEELHANMDAHRARP